MSAPNFLAGGTIQPCRIVVMSDDYTVIQAAATTDKPVGVSQEGSHDAPGLTGSATDAARSGHQIRVYTEGDECLLEIAASVTSGQYLKFATGGKGTPLVGSESGAALWVIGYALEDGSSGEKIRIQIKITPIGSVVPS